MLFAFMNSKWPTNNMYVINFENTFMGKYYKFNNK